MSADPPVVPRVDPEVERSRETAARLMEAFARKLRGNRTVRNAAERVGHAAHYMQNHSRKEIAARIESYARRKPIAALSIAAALGFVAGRALGRRIFR
jgi:ElaB/YqjD/DUF883 family membrane-anchored ribosome-binding protein